MFAILFGGIVSTTHADTDPVYANGPIVAQTPGGRFLKPGQEDCPAWFPFSGCYTFRVYGMPFIALQ